MPDGAQPLPAFPPRIKVPRKAVHTPVTFQRERFAEMCVDLGPLARRHDREMWPNRKWGRLKINVPAYMQMEAGGVLHMLTARAGRVLVGYCFEIIMHDLTYDVRSSLGEHIYLHPDYRVSEGLSVRKTNGYRFLEAREKMLDEMKVERRRVSTKAWLMFGPLLEMFGYQPEAVVFYRISKPAEAE